MTTSIIERKTWSYHCLSDAHRPWLCQCFWNVWCWGFCLCLQSGHRQNQQPLLMTKSLPKSAQNWKRMGNCNAVGLFNAEPFSSQRGCSWLKWSPQTSPSMRWPANVVVAGMKWMGNSCGCFKPCVMKCRDLSGLVPGSGVKIIMRWFPQPAEPALTPRLEPLTF